VIPPLSGPDKQILDLLEAGRTFDVVCAIGAYRKAWRPSDVHRIATRPAQLPRGKPPVKGERRGPAKQPIPHGTESGYTLERKRGVPYCEDCRAAHANAQRERRNRSA
jgi:hypothetical protein